LSENLHLTKQLCFAGLKMAIYPKSHEAWPNSIKVAGSVILACVFLALLASGHRTAEQGVHPAEALRYKVVFADEFDGSILTRDGDKRGRWTQGVWFSSQIAPLENISANGSVLSLTWTRSQSAPDTSITTLAADRHHAQAWRYGYFEVRMRWNPVNGAWPAIWMIPVQDATRENVYDGVRRSGEIDIFEGQGDQPRKYFGTVHEWVDSRVDQASRDNSFSLPPDADMRQFHTYAVLWVPGKVTWYFDNRPLHTEKTPPVMDKQDFYLVLTMQEGMGWKVGDTSGSTADRMTMDVDWVRVWQRAGK
jgi:hypothetical protein